MHRLTRDLHIAGSAFILINDLYQKMVLRHYFSSKETSDHTSETSLTNGSFHLSATVFHIQAALKVGFVERSNIFHFESTLRIILIILSSLPFHRNLRNILFISLIAR